MPNVMPIESLEIENYRLFRDVRLPNLARLTVVVGANGSGKSTLFDVFEARPTEDGRLVLLSDSRTGLSALRDIRDLAAI